MLLELTLYQMPKRFTLEWRHYDMSYTPIMKAEKLQKVLIVISDVTADVEREALRAAAARSSQRLRATERDRKGFLESFPKTDDQIAAIESGSIKDRSVLKRSSTPSKATRSCSTSGASEISVTAWRPASPTSRSCRPQPSGPSSRLGGIDCERA